MTQHGQEVCLPKKRRVSKKGGMKIRPKWSLDSVQTTPKKWDIYTYFFDSNIIALFESTLHAFAMGDIMHCSRLIVHKISLLLIDHITTMDVVLFYLCWTLLWSKGLGKICIIKWLLMHGESWDQAHLNWFSMDGFEYIPSNFSLISQEKHEEPFHKKWHPLDQYSSLQK